MNRRRFLTLTGLALGASAQAGPLTQRAAKAAALELESARARAERAGKPFVLIPVSGDHRRQTRAQTAWGALFSTPNDEQLSLLALCEFGFGPVPEGVTFDEDLACALIAMPGKAVWGPVLLEGAESLLDASALHAALKKSLSTDDGIHRSLVQSALSLRGVVDPQGLYAAGPTSAPRLKLSDADRGAAFLYSLIEQSEDEDYRRWAHGVLATAAALRLYEGNPVGARWKDAYPDVDPCPTCGLAIVSKTSRLFLDAYTR